MRAQAQGLSWTEFAQRFSPTHGPIRLGNWATNKHNSSSGTYTATLAIEHSITSSSVTATGPIAALTSMLYNAGFPLEILSFHQQSTSAGTATFVLCEHDGQRHWAIAINDDPTLAALDAIVAGANLLHR
jgi:hypothetical protein